MAGIGARRSNADMRASYQRLADHGKPHKVAITAVIRKLVVLAKALLRDGLTNHCGKQQWESSPPSSSKRSTGASPRVEPEQATGGPRWTSARCSKHSADGGLHRTQDVRPARTPPLPSRKRSVRPHPPAPPLPPATVGAILLAEGYASLAAD